MSFVITPEQIEEAATEKVVKTGYGYDVYAKSSDGQWVKDHWLVTDPQFRRTYKVYADSTRPTEIIKWGKVIQ